MFSILNVSQSSGVSVDGLFSLVTAWKKICQIQEQCILATWSWSFIFLRMLATSQINTWLPGVEKFELKTKTTLPTTVQTSGLNLRQWSFLDGHWWVFNIWFPEGGWKLQGKNSQVLRYSKKVEPTFSSLLQPNYFNYSEANWEESRVADSPTSPWSEDKNLGRRKPSVIGVV